MTYTINEGLKFAAAMAANPAAYHPSPELSDFILSMLPTPADEPLAHPVPLSTMEAYRELAEKARDVIDAFGGLAPDWLREEAAGLENATVTCEIADPRS